MAEHWDEDQQDNPEILNQIIGACDLQAGQKVLDAACGTGVLFPRLLAHDPGQLTAIDISDAMTEKARYKHHDHRLEIITADLLLFDANGFDRAILYNAYPHFFDKSSLARKMCELLAINGRFVIAHSASRDLVNSRHAACGASDVSVDLQRASDEARWFKPYFNIDICIDTDEVYIISGTKLNFDI
jgi:demethylmenaquinone methyltransferase/2-methoxy-6-polyprenyl-1,4-benzoquinol methylase